MEDSSGTDSPAVLLRGGRDYCRRLLFRDPVLPYGDTWYGNDESVRCVAEVSDIGLAAQLEISTWRDDGVAGFLRGLADDFRGWAGSRNWTSLNGQLRIEATHDGRGHVTLLVSLRDDSYPYDDHWTLSVPFLVEAGAEMATLADRFEVFFAAARSLPSNGH